MERGAKDEGALQVATALFSWSVPMSSICLDSMRYRVGDQLPYLLIKGMHACSKASARNQLESFSAYTIVLELSAFSIVLVENHLAACIYPLTLLSKMFYH
jgi:hypothetical protein